MYDGKGGNLHAEHGRLVMRKPTELHGYSRTPEYRAWRGMIDRVDHDSRYRKRGIKVARIWRRSFVAFREHVGSRPSASHSLDRINNDGNYEPGNVRWATNSEQQRNTRANVFLSLQGATRSIAEWSSILGIPYATIRGRHLRGYVDEKALSVTQFSRGARSRNGVLFVRP